jgi:hypothetical protein
MRLRAGPCLLACCAALAACTAAPKGPDTAVTTPTVGRPLPPASAQAALSAEAFTPYAALGISNTDGLAPGESSYALIGPCMSAEGYPDVNFSDGIVQVPFFSLFANLAFTLPWDGWGYLGAADAQQYGFRVNPGSAMTALDVGALPQNRPAVPAAEQAAANNCATIWQDFTNAMNKGPLASIVILGNDISTDVQHDAAVNAAARVWSACMARNGYSFDQPEDVGNQEWQAMYGGHNVAGPSTAVSPAVQQAQLAVAVTDVGCTQSSDLAGIYFAVQASYEQQLVTANQQARSASTAPPTPKS